MPIGTGGKVAASLFFLFFLGLGLAFVGLVARESLAGLKTWTWPKTDCEITQSSVVENNQGRRNSGDFYFKVEYRYRFNGRVFGSDRHTLKSTSFSDYGEAARLAEKYPVGAHAVCYVNPTVPAVAVLKRGSLFFPLMIFFPLIFVAIGAIGIYSAWRSASSTKGTQPISDRATGTQRQGFGLAVMALFLVLAAVLFYIFLVGPLTRIVRARQWPAVPCTIISSEVKRHSGNRGSTYSVNILYRYVVNDREYKANRYEFMRASSSGYAGKQAIVSRYPPGASTLCFVNPKDPTDAVLERGFTPIMWVGLLPLVFVVLGSLGLLSTIRKFRLARDTGVGGAAFISGTATVVPRFDNVSASSPRVLQPKASPANKFFAALIIALFWNGFVSVFLVQIFKSWHSGPFEWFLALFMSVFVLVGIVILLAAIYFFLSLFNPRPRLVVTPGVARLGEALRIEWEIAGRVESLQNLRVRLEGREEATYSRGTKTSTDRNVFADLEIGATTIAQEMRSGSGSITIAANLMHSFNGQHNKIVWAVCVGGEIPRWPDLDEEFPLTVLPANANRSLSS